MKAAVLEGTKKITIEKRADPGDPGPGQVRIRMKSVGICGSDVHYYSHGRIGDFVVKAPMILGHEPAGIIEAVGSGVTELQPGQVVAIEPGVPCLQCSMCLTGRYNLCQHIAFMATPPFDGALVEVIHHPATFTYPAPLGMTPDIACLSEPMSVAVAANRRARHPLGEAALVVGGGPIGLLTALVAAEGGAEVTVLEVQPYRQMIAKNMGLNVAEDVDPGKFTTIFECSGSNDVVEKMTSWLQPGGVLVLVGMHERNLVHLNVFDTITKEIDVRGVFRYANTYPTALTLLQRLGSCLQAFQSSFIGMDDVPTYFNTVDKSGASSIKTVVQL